MRAWRIFALVALLLGGAAGRDAVDDWIDGTVLPVLALETSAEVRDRHGVLLRAYTVGDGLWRLGVGLDQVDPAFVAMLLGYEDKRFYRHSGVDMQAMARAVAQALWHGRVVSGGSTLTMQVARMLEDSGTGQWAGKLRQIRLAWALERYLSKDQILTLYLTQAPYGGNIEGIRAATLAWFGKEPHRLTPAQSALLVALPQAPVARRPDRDPAAALAARDRVLARVSGRVISKETASAAMGEPMRAAKHAFPSLAAHMADRALATGAHQPRLTLDSTVQAKLEVLAAQAVRGRAENLSVAIILADHRSGEILASVGSAGYGQTDARQGYVDMTRALRSPGSTLKPLVYAMAFDLGLAHPETLIDDGPKAFGSYAPQNFDGQFRGEIRVADALRLSLNIPVVTLTQEIGLPRLMAALARAGVRAKVPGGVPGLAVALGGLGVTLEDMVGLYAALAQGGKAVPLHWFIGENQGDRQQVVSRAAAWQVGHILSGLAPPPGAPLNRLAYKTGTSYGHRDAWALGYDGAHVAGVWIGRADGTPVPGAFGGDLAAPVLFEVFQRLKPALEALPPPPPETLMVSAANLPQPLQRFRSRKAVFETGAGGPKLAFPPDGARLVLEGQHLVAKVRDGVAPFTWLANGVPVLTVQHRREVELPDIGAGFTDIAVIDAQGRVARAQVRID
jgi:penicillin-binding protein 1C